MKRLLAILALTASTPALAADIIEYIPPPPEPVIIPPSWTGLYLGGQAGYAFQGDGSGIPGAFITIPGTPGTPGSPGTPGTPGTPGDPGTPPIVVPAGTFEFSFACAGTDDSAACAGAVVADGVETPIMLTRAELSAAVAAVGGDPGDLDAIGAAGALEVTVGEEVVIPGTPPTPGTPGTPGTPPTPPTPGTPPQTVPIDSLPGFSRFEDDSDGFIGGVHVGYDHQFGYNFGGGALVVGALADLSSVDIERFGGVTDGVDFITARQELDYLATLRLRAGIGFERSLIYATGGLAFGNVETTIVNTLFDDGASESDTRVGYAVGAGVEFLVTPNFSLGLEYLYTDLGDGDDFSLNYDLGEGSVLTVDGNDDLDFHTVWAKASFRFN